MGEGVKNYGVYHHVVYSVKGGCGKTTFSLRLLMTGLLKENQKKRKDEGYEKVDGRAEINCMFDMDFLGTSLLNALEQDADSGGNGEPSAEAGADGATDGKPDYILMNDLIFNSADVRDLANRSNLVVEEKNPTRVKYIIPSSCHEKDKEQFHVKRRNTPLLRYDEFRHEIAGIVSKIKLVESSKNIADRENAAFDMNFIYDMPPNADGYTEALFDYLLDRAAKGERVFLYLVYNNNATLMCDLEWLDGFLSSGRLTDGIDIYFVDNKITRFNPDTEKIKEADATAITEMAKRYGIGDRYHVSPEPMKFLIRVAMFNYGTDGKKVGLKNLFDGIT